MRHARALLVIAAGLLGSAPAAASQDTADPGPLESLGAARELVGAEKWSKAVEALGAVLDAHPDDPRLLPRLTGIERDLQLCRFRMQVRKLKPADVLGPGATRLSTTSWQAEFQFDAPAGPLWASRSNAHTLQAPVIPPISISFKAKGVYDDRRVAGVLFDAVDDEAADVLVSSGAYSSSDDRSLGSLAPAEVNEKAKIAQIWPGGERVEAEAFPMAFGSFATKTSIAITDDRITLRCDGSTLKADVGLGTSHVVLHAGDAEDIRIKAKLDPEWAERRMAQAWDEALERWVEDKWLRSKNLPGWASAALRRQEQAMDFDSGDDDVARQLELSRGVFPTARDDEGRNVVVAQEIADVYLQGLADLAAGRLGEAERALSDVLERAPTMDRARVWRAWVRTELRRWDGAAADADAFHEAFVGLAPAAIARARIAVHGGDLAAAEAALAHAVDSPLPHPRTQALLECVRRIRTGPGFPYPHGAIRDRYRVIGGVPEARCVEIAEALAAARGHFAALAGDVADGGGRCTVYAFASRQDLDRFVEGLSRYVRSGGAAYLPQVPTLLVDASGDGSEWLRDLRKMAWSEHLYRRTELVPPWLFAGGERLLRGGDPAAARLDPAVDPRAFIPSVELVRAHPDRFRRGSPLIGQSRELVRTLVTHEDPALRTLPLDIVTAMGEGVAWADVLAEGPLSHRIAAACAAFDAAR